MAQKHPEAALKPDPFGCLDFKVKKSFCLLLSVAVCIGRGERMVHNTGNLIYPFKIVFFEHIGSRLLLSLLLRKGQGRDGKVHAGELLKAEIVA